METITYNGQQIGIESVNGYFNTYVNSVCVNNSQTDKALCITAAKYMIDNPKDFGLKF